MIRNLSSRKRGIYANCSGNHRLFRHLYRGTDGAANAFQFEYLTSLGFAAIVIFLGHAIVNHSGLLRKFASPRRWCPACCSPSWWPFEGTGVIALSFT